MPIDWKSAESVSRLLIAVVASMEGQKLELRRVAALYGEGATYDAIENRFRVIKKEAAKLREVVDNGALPAVVARPVRLGADAAGGKATPKKSRVQKDPDSVASGRVAKSTPRRRGGKVAKNEMEVGDGGSSPAARHFDDSPTPVRVKEEKTGHGYTYDDETGSFYAGADEDSDDEEGV